MLLVLVFILYVVAVGCVACREQLDCRSGSLAPSEMLGFEVGLSHGYVQQFVVLAVDDNVGCGEKAELLLALLLERREVLLVRLAEVCEYADSRLYDAGELVHLARL